jgi:hypothetical protein
MTVGELFTRMSSRELTEWMAYTKHYEAIPDPWMQTGVIASALLAPHLPRGMKASPSDFVPLDTPPQHQLQTFEQLMKLRRELGQHDG